MIKARINKIKQTTLYKSKIGWAIKDLGIAYCERNLSERRKFLHLLNFFSEKVQRKLYKLPLYIELNMRGEIVK